MIKIMKPKNMDELLEDHWKWFEKRMPENRPAEMVDFNEGNGDIEEIIKVKSIDECYSIIKKHGKMKPKKGSELLKFWGYEEWCLSGNALNYMRVLGIRVCPFCNRHNLDYSELEYKKMRRAPFDHFFPRSEYPYLSCSLINLIPCCDYCNLEKGTIIPLEEKCIIYPYEEEFGKNGKFKLIDKNKKGVVIVKDLKDVIKENLALLPK